MNDWARKTPVPFPFTEPGYIICMQDESKIAAIIEKIMGAIVFVMLVWLVISAGEELIWKVFM